VIPLSTADAPDNRLLGGAISIGNFDGVHLGHAALITRLRAMADRIGGPAVAVTFDPPPAFLLRPQQMPPQLTTIQRREELLRRCGVDGVVVIRTTQDLLNQSPEDFFQSLVVGALQARGMVEGPNFFFGRNRAGNPVLLRRLCDQSSIDCEIAEPETMADRMLSSTRVRELLAAGDVAGAGQILTAPYRLSGRVISGAGRGRLLGFPTANLADVETMIPDAGVYACRAYVDGQTIGAAVNIGSNPTFGDTQHKIEVHLLDFVGDLYNRSMAIDFVCRVRPVKQFDSGQSLQRQVAIDLAEVRCLLGLLPSS
jgi:riboflavin kinase/FMN adenylyltransferase